MDESEFLHLLQQQANRQITGIKSAYVGYIQSYDPSTHMVQVLNPLAGQGPTPDNSFGGGPMGLPLKSPWIPLASSYVGLSNGTGLINAGVTHYGIQIAPLGGASQFDPTAGEQVLVINLQNEIGYSACAFLMFNDHAIPPGAGIPVLGVPLAPGEMLVVTATGTVVHFSNSGDVTILARKAGAQEGDLRATANGGIFIATVADGAAPSAVISGNIDIQSRVDLNTYSIGYTIIKASPTTGGILLSTLPSPDDPLTGDIDMSAADGINMSASTSIIMQSGTQIEISAGTKVKMTGLTGISISAGQPQVDPGTNNLEMRALVDVLVTAGQHYSSESFNYTKIRSTNNGITIAAHTAATTPLDGNIEFYASQDMLMLPTHDAVMNPNHDAFVRATSGGVMIATSTQTYSPLSNNIVMLSNAEIRIRSTTGMSISNNAINPTISAGGDTQCEAQRNWNIRTIAGGISLGANVDPRASLSSGDIYVNANAKITILAGGASFNTGILMNATNYGIGISTGSSILAPTSGTRDIVIGSQSLLALSTRSGGGTDITLDSQRDILNTASRDFRVGASTFIGLQTGGSSLTGNSGEIQLNASGSVKIKGNSGSGSVTVLTANTSTLGAVQIGDSSNTPYELLTRYLWDNFLVNHTHGGVTAGGANTLGPNSVPTLNYPYKTHAVQAN